MERRVLAMSGVLFLLILLFIGAGIADSDPSFDIDETVVQDLSIDNVMSINGYYEDGTVTYAASKWMVLDVDGEDREQQVLAEEEWKIHTENGWADWQEGETPENVLGRDDPEQVNTNVEREETVQHTFSEEGRYAFAISMAKIEGTADWREDGSQDWNYEIEEVDRDKFVFAIDEDSSIIEVFG